MKHVVFAHRKLSFGGGERVLVEQVAALADLPVRISVLFNKDPDKRDVEPELRARHPRVEAVLHLPGAFGSWQWLRRNPADLLVVCNHKGVQRALPFLGRRPPILVTLHEHYQRHLAKYRGIRKLVSAWIITWAFEEAVRAQLGDQPCTVIHPLYPRKGGVPPDAAAKAGARAALGLPEDAWVVGYAGQMDRRKDPVSTLHLAEALEQAFGRPLHMLLAGREEPATALALDQALAGSRLRERAVRTGPLADIGQAFMALDLYLMTSRNEGFFPIALLEAMERGVPVVVPTIGGISTQLRDGEGGFLIAKPDDRAPIAPALLEATARRVAEVMADPAAWEQQRRKAVALASGLAQGYDAAGRFRELVARWL